MEDLKKGFKDALTILSSVNESLRGALVKEHQGHFLNEAVSAINKLIGKAGTLAGEHGASGVKTEDFKPITKFMGEHIHDPEKAKKITEEDADCRMKAGKYKDKIRKLYMEWDSIAPESLLNSHVGTPDEDDLRAVAKMAGMSDFKTAPLNVDFVKKVSKAMADLVKKAKDNQDMEEKIQQDKAKLQK